MGSLRVRQDSVTSLSRIGEGNGNHSSVLAWRIPGTGEPGGLLSIGSHTVGHNRSDLAAAAALEEVMNMWPVVDIYLCFRVCKLLLLALSC